jgi:hypothetical protein
MVKVKVETILEAERHIDISRVIVDINRIIKQFNVDSSISIRLLLDQQQVQQQGETPTKDIPDGAETIGDIPAQPGGGIPGISAEVGVDPDRDDPGIIQAGGD